MIVVIIVLAVLVVLFGLYLFTMAPRKINRANMDDYKGLNIAHRGMFNNEEGIPENSMMAFKRAVDNGFGIELDLHLTTDKKIIVYHDKCLERGCGVNKLTDECSYEELQQLNLFGTNEKIPLFEDVLKLVDGKVPFIIELKGTTKNVELAQAAHEMLKNYKGRYIIESFNPYLLQEWKRIAPNDVRGLLTCGFINDKETKTTFGLVLSDLMIVNMFIRPDFIAYNKDDDKHFPFVLCKKIFRPYLAAWTIRTQEQYDRCKKEYDVCICENLDKLAL